MPRRKRKVYGGFIYHLLNRGNAKSTSFQNATDYQAFEQVWREASAIYSLPLLAYCIMPNHWHAIVWPPRGEDQLVTKFMHWLTMTHTLRHHKFYGTTGAGHLYQARYKAFPVQTDVYLRRVLRYVERNPLRAGLVESAEYWRWSSLWKQQFARSDDEGLTLARWPFDRPQRWCEIVNTPQTDAEERAIRKSVTRGRPYGNDAWVESTAKALDLKHTLRDAGRPRKECP